MFEASGYFPISAVFLRAIIGMVPTGRSLNDIDDITYRWFINQVYHSKGICGCADQPR